MDTSSKDSEPLETEESAVNNAENTSFILGNGECVTPHKHAAEVTPLRCTSDTFKSPLNFSTVTVEQLGITPESFVKNSSGESSSYLKKSRRRSTVGVRGSPETNHLIRFIAQQRNLKNASLTKNSPFQGSPVLYRNVHSLREQMSAFQSAFHSIKENEKMTGCPEFSENERKFETTGSTKKESLGECQQSEFPAKLSSKRRRIASPSNSDGNVTDAAHLRILSPAAFPSADRMCAIKASADPSEKSSESGCIVEESAPRSELTEASSEGKENSKAPAFLNVRKRKRVTFGEDLSPEVFDESLPANTPLRKGETPVRKKDLSSLSPLPVEQSPVPERLSQPDFDDKGENLVLKSCRKKKAKGKKKSVQKSLYGERDIASKKPLLSPIPELPEVSEVAPSVPSVWRMCSDDFISNGELEDVKLPKEKNLLPQNPDVQLIPGCNKYDVSGFGSPYMRSSSSLTNAAFEQDSNIHTTEIHGNRSGNPSPDFALQSQEASAAGQNVENLFEIFKISEDVNVRCENQDGFLVIPEGRLPAKHFMPGSQKARGCSEAVSTDGVEGSKAPGEDLGRNSREGSSGVSSRERKYRRPSMCCSDGQSVHLENQPSYGVSGSVEKSLEDSDLYKDLSDAIEQAFQRTESETKVRRSTRLQKGLESEGLVWVSLPCPPTSWPSQKTKRRTVGTLGSRGPESEPSRQNPCGLPFASGEDHREGFAAAAAPSLPRGRRKSFCTSALADVRDTTRSKGRRRTFLSQKGEEALQVTSTEPDITEN
ncbi:cell division cycle-associated protein 2 [Camelus ferus]|nr:cell division cycle-associated protein 2 [Camelus ferus]